MYQLITGPLLWLSFGIFFIGAIVRVVRYIRGLNWQMDRVTYRVNVSYGIKGALRSIFFWLFPFGTRSWRAKPGMTILFFVFHIGLIITPIFLMAHNIILKERWGISLPTIPESLADLLTIAVIVCVIFLVLRRIAFPEVRILTTFYDYLLLAITVAPFVTGFVAGQQTPGYQGWFMAHIICGEIMLIAIPFTKLSHVVMFFLSRGQLDIDYGIKRGGMKGKGLAW
jgi:nitrate reductase gamma subunit